VLLEDVQKGRIDKGVADKIIEAGVEGRPERHYGEGPEAFKF
jgi:hypothetical protein